MVLLLVEVEVIVVKLVVSDSGQSTKGPAPAPGRHKEDCGAVVISGAIVRIGTGSWYVMDGVTDSIDVGI